MLNLYNSLTKTKEVFVPIVPNKVSMYVCGMTVYDFCHLGHARVMVVFDMVRRWLERSGYEVTYVRNITDIDDKIIFRAINNGETIQQLTQRFIDFMDEDAQCLGVLKPSFEPRATEYIDAIIAMIQRLIDNGYAYVAEDGDVNFSVRRFDGYGKLSGKSLDDLFAGERVDVVDAKHDPLDFVLWKQAKPNEPFWDSPWGQGRPGWHIECSAMSCSLLGSHFDIHGGGSDLQFPHHENEIAQSEGASGHRFVNYWMHNGFVRVDNEKMSKSLGNFFTIRDILADFDAEVVRFFILRAHYRSSLNYSDTLLQDAKQALSRLYTALNALNRPIEAEVNIDWQHPEAAAFKQAMNDDFATPSAVAVLFDLASKILKKPDEKDIALLKALGNCLGLLERTPDAFFKGAVEDVADIETQLQARLQAKQAKDFAEADRIRETLLAQGIILEDHSEGTSWRRQ